MFGNLFGGGTSAPPKQQQQAPAARAFPPPLPSSGARPGAFGPSAAAPPPEASLSPSTSTGSSGPTGGSDLFGSMSVTSSSAAPQAAATATGFSFLSSPVSSEAPAAAAASGFSFGAGAPTAAAATSSGFAFAAASAPTPAAAGAATSGFAFGGGGGASAPPSSGFAFGSGAPGAVAGGSAGGPSSTAGSAGVDPAEALGAGGVKKKKPTFRPGFERGGGEAPSAAAAAAAAPPPTEPVSSLLAGMQVHEGGSGGGEQPGALLSGLLVHAAGEAPAAEGPGGMLAGLQMHGSGAGEGERDAQAGMGGAAASGFSFPTAAAPVEAAAPTPADAAAPPFSIPSPAGQPPQSRTASAFPGAPASGAADPSTSSTTQMRSVVSSLGEASRVARLRLADLKARLRSLHSEVSVASDAVARLQLAVTDLELRQDESVRGERYEEAEALALELKALQTGALAAASSKRAALLQQRSALEREVEGAFEEISAAARETVSGLGSYAVERAGVLASFRGSAHGAHAAAGDRIVVEEEQLRLKEKGVDNESALVEEERAGVETTIAEQTTALVEACTAQREAHERLVGEVAELERALAAKRSAEAAARGALKETEGKIASIRAKFEKQGKRLASKAEAIEAEKRECAGEARALAAAKAEFAASKRRDRARERGLLRQVEANAGELGTARALCSALDALGAARDKLNGEARACAAACEALREEVERAVRGVRTNAVRKATLGAQASALQKVIDGLDAKEPQLAEEKKRAVAEKKFKEAGRLKEEGEKMVLAKDKATRELSDCTSGIDSCDHDSVALEEGVVGARAALAAAERRGDEARAAALDEAIRAAARFALSLGAPRPTPAIAATIALCDPVSLALLPGAEESAEDGASDLSNAELAIEGVETGAERARGGGHWLSSVQSAAVEMVVAERDVLVDEAQAVAGRLGRPFALAQLLAEVAEEAGQGAAAAAEAAAGEAPALAAGSQQPVSIAAAAAAADADSLASGSGSGSGSGGGEGSAQPGEGVQPTQHLSTGFSFGAGGASLAAPEGGESGHVSGLAGGLGMGAVQEGGVGSGLGAAFLQAAAAAAAGVEDGSASAGAEEMGHAWDAGEGREGGAAAAAPPGPSLHELALGVQSIAASITEKEEAISAAVQREDFDAAGAWLC